MATIERCRASGSGDLRTILDFGDTPLADVLLGESDLDAPDATYPLRLVFCPESALVQITENVPPDILYCGEYPYYTSVSEGLVRHFSASAEALMGRKPMGPESLVVEAASNDGCHAQAAFRSARGIARAGRGPGPGSGRGRQRGGHTRPWCRFFDTEASPAS